MAVDCYCCFNSNCGCFWGLASSVIDPPDDNDESIDVDSQEDEFESRRLPPVIISD